MTIDDWDYGIPAFPRFEEITALVDSDIEPRVITAEEIERILEQPRLDWRDVLARVDAEYYTAKRVGWGKPNRARRWHYFRPGGGAGWNEIESLCGIGQDPKVFAGEPHGIVLHPEAPGQACVHCTDRMARESP